MRHPRMLSAALLSMLAWTGALAVVATPGHSQGDDRADMHKELGIKTHTVPEGANKLTQLRFERANSAARAFDIQTAMFTNGQTSLPTVLDAAERAIEAELPLSADRAAIISIHERLVLVAQKREDHARARMQVGQANSVDVEDAVFERLGAEIALEEARTEAKAP